MWDTENGKLLHKVDIHRHDIVDIKLSGDGLRAFTLDDCSMQAWSLQTGQVVGTMGLGYIEVLRSLIVDGSKVWAYWPKSNYRGWDSSIPGSTPMESPNISTLPSSSKLWNLEQARIKNPATGEVFFHLSGRFSSPVDVKCDDSYLVAGYQTGEVLILDLTNVR